MKDRTKMSEHIICTTKEFVDDLVDVLDLTIDILQNKGKNKILSDEEYDALDKAKSEREIYKKVKTIMENKGHLTMCISSDIKRSGKT